MGISHLLFVCLYKSFFCLNKNVLFPQLANTEEFIEGQFTGNLGEILIR